MAATPCKRLADDPAFGAGVPDPPHEARSPRRQCPRLRPRNKPRTHGSVRERRESRTCKSPALLRDRCRAGRNTTGSRDRPCPLRRIHDLVVASLGGDGPEMQADDRYDHTDRNDDIENDHSGAHSGAPFLVDTHIVFEGVATCHGASPSFRAWAADCLDLRLTEAPLGAVQFCR